jgi:hypothetical protein
MNDECEIVKNFAMNKPFFYCRTHKCEAISASWCPDASSVKSKAAEPRPQNNFKYADQGGGGTGPKKAQHMFGKGTG